MNSQPRSISLVIPVYNEGEHLIDFLQIIDELVLPLEKELVIVNDRSTDSSGEILKSYKFKSKVQLFDQPYNQGKGAAIRKGFELATGDLIVVQDADFEYDPTELPLLLEPLIKGKADVVYGSRFKKTGQQVHRTFHYLGNRVLTMISNLLSGLYVSDMETCYKLFRADVIKNIKLESDRFGFEPEVTAKLAKLKLRVLEIPISYHPRNYMEGKKITWKDGLAALWHMINFNLFKAGSQNYREGLPERYIPKGGNWL